MNSWWQLGEGAGIEGNELRVWSIQCPFCLEQGNFKKVFHAEKKKHHSVKKLNFDTLECGSCKGYVMVLWSVAESGGIHHFRVLPWPLRWDKFPGHWPDAVGRYWLQAHRSLNSENWDAAAVMAR